MRKNGVEEEKGNLENIVTDFMFILSKFLTMCVK